MNVIRLPKGTPLDEVLGLIMGTHERLEVFTHVDDVDPTKMTAYNVTYIRRHCEKEKFQIFRVPISESNVEVCRNQRGLEPHRLARLTIDALKVPVIFCEQEDNTHVLIDGTHRAVWAWDHGFREVLAYIVKPEVWKQYLLPIDKDLTAEELLKKDSGL